MTRKKTKIAWGRPGVNCIHCPYSLICMSQGEPSKIRIIKDHRAAYNCGLKEAKDYVEKHMHCHGTETPGIIAVSNTDVNVVLEVGDKGHVSRYLPPQVALQLAETLTKHAKKVKTLNSYEVHVETGVDNESR